MLLTVYEVAARLKQSPEFVWKLCARGELPHYRHGRYSIRVDDADLKHGGSNTTTQTAGQRLPPGVVTLLTLWTVNQTSGHLAVSRLKTPYHQTTNRRQRRSPMQPTSKVDLVYVARRRLGTGDTAIWPGELVDTTGWKPLHHRCLHQTRTDSSRPGADG